MKDNSLLHFTHLPWLIRLFGDFLVLPRFILIALLHLCKFALCSFVFLPMLTVKPIPVHTTPEMKARVPQCSLRCMFRTGAGEKLDRKNRRRETRESVLVLSHFSAEFLNSTSPFFLSVSRIVRDSSSLLVYQLSSAATLQTRERCDTF